MAQKKDGKWLLDQCKWHVTIALAGNQRFMANAEDLVADACCKILNAKSNIEEVHDGYIKQTVKNLIIDLARKWDPLRDPATKSLDTDPHNIQNDLEAREDTLLDVMTSLDREALTELSERIRCLIRDRRFKTLDDHQKHVLDRLVSKLEELGRVVMTRKELSGYLGVSTRTIDDWRKNGCVKCLGHPTKTLYSLPETIRKLVSNRGKPRLS